MSINDQIIESETNGYSIQSRIAIRLSLPKKYADSVWSRNRKKYVHTRIQKEIHMYLENLFIYTFEIANITQWWLWLSPATFNSQNFLKKVCVFGRFLPTPLQCQTKWATPSWRDHGMAKPKKKKRGVGVSGAQLVDGALQLTGQGFKVPREVKKRSKIYYG